MIVPDIPMPPPPERGERQRILWKKEHIDWLIKVYPYSETEEIAKAMKCSSRPLEILMCKELGVRKSPEFIYEKHVKAGKQTWKVRPSDEELRRRALKCSETKKKQFKAERRRVMFGLPQKTKLRVVSPDRRLKDIRHVLIKQGYIVTERLAKVFYYDENTKRCMRSTEERYTQKFKFEFLHINELEK